MSEQLVLFDLPSRPPTRTWSLNPFKTRMLLNYKGVDYRTQWTEYPDLKPTLEGHIAPNEQGAQYTCPAVRLPDGTYAMDSAKIAPRIQELYPTPHIQIGTSYQTKVQDELAKIMSVIGPDVFPEVPKVILNERSIPYWHETRRIRFGGKPLEEVQEELGGEQVWEKADVFMKAVAQMLREQPEGPFFEGKQVTYVDFIWAGYLRCLQCVGGARFERATASDREPHVALLEACQPWLARDDH